MEQLLGSDELMVVGLGAVYREHLVRPLATWGQPDKYFLIDREGQRFTDIRQGRKVVADITKAPFASFAFSDKSIVALIATPAHLEPLKSLFDLGIKKFIVEKPLVHNLEEVRDFRSIVAVNSGLKVYALEMCLTKLLPLYLLTGVINPDDPRWKWVEDEQGRTPHKCLYQSLEDKIGDLEGIEATIIEGGDFGVSDLNARPWLETDRLRGGILLDLGTHVLSPLIMAGLIKSPDDVSVNIAKRYALGENRKNFVDAAYDQPEVYIDALLGVQYQDRKIPLSIKLSKTFHDGGLWSLVIRGSRGSILGGFRTGQKLIIETTNTQLMLKQENGVYPSSFKEARLYFDDCLPSFDGNQKALLDAIAIIDKIKQASLVRFNRPKLG